MAWHIELPNSITIPAIDTQNSMRKIPNFIHVEVSFVPLLSDEIDKKHIFSLMVVVKLMALLCVKSA